MKDTYLIGAIIVGGITFLSVWIYAFVSWGFLFGLMFGWIPALIAAYITGFLWPIVVIFFLLGLIF